MRKTNQRICERRREKEENGVSNDTTQQALHVHKSVHKCGKLDGMCLCIFVLPSRKSYEYWHGVEGRGMFGRIKRAIATENTNGLFQIFPDGQCVSNSSNKGEEMKENHFIFDNW